MDVTDAVEDGELTITVRVSDGTERGGHTRGKQRTKRGGIWYTSQSGIWQTVWLEAVPLSYIRSLRITPHYDEAEVEIEPEIVGDEPAFALFNGQSYPLPGCIPVPDFEPWSPENPKLYGFHVRCGEDLVQSYFAMRKFAVCKDRQGVPRLFLNGEPYFHNGVLDQGYYPDGLLTPPTDKAMVDDIQLLKDMGFTMVRKHIKIEPLRWYYYCDRMGILVWQDMVNGGGKYNPLMIAVLPFLNIMFKDNTKTAYKLFSRGDAAGRAEFEREALETVDYLKNVVSLAMWVPFNEGWGQFDSDRISELIVKKDPTRTIDRTSGWHDQHTGDFVSKHIYFTPIWVPKDERCYLLSEFGGFSRPIQGHMLSDAIPFGYRMYFTKWRLQRAYKKTYEKRIIANIPRGLSACVFTQLSDVEGEINGLITYDRRVDKMDRSFVRSVNDRVRY